MNAAADFRVLLVEDDGELASLVAEFLAGHGFEVAIESREDRAVARIKTESPDAVILDVNLPGMDGFSVCREVRSTPAEADASERFIEVGSLLLHAGRGQRPARAPGKSSPKQLNNDNLVAHSNKTRRLSQLG